MRVWDLGDVGAAGAVAAEEVGAPEGPIFLETLHPTPYTLHPTPYILHPTLYTLHPTPYTLHPIRDLGDVGAAGAVAADEVGAPEAHLQNNFFTEM